MDWVINLAGFADDSIVDGPGLRTTLFAQGCPHHCPGCHNPETHSFGTGRDYTLEALRQHIRQNPLARGVTFSGGEPFAQAGAFAALAALLRADGYELAAYSGYTFQELLEGTPQQLELLSQLSVLVDGRFLLSQRNLNLKFRGSENQCILDVPASLAAGRAVLSTDPRWVGNTNLA